MNKLILFALALAVLGLTSDRTNIPPQKFISFNNTQNRRAHPHSSDVPAEILRGK